MSEELIQVESGVSVYDGLDVDISTGVENARVKPANVTVVQPMTTDPQGARLGQFLNADTGEAVDSFRVVLLKAYMNRPGLFPAGATGKGVQPICRSFDGLKPSKTAKVPQAKECGHYDDKGKFVAVCKHASWRKVESNGKVLWKLPCGPGYRLLLIDTKYDEPIFFQVKGTAVSIFEEFRSQLKRAIERTTRLRGERYTALDFTFTMKTIKDPKSPNYKLLFTEIEPHDTPGDYLSHYLTVTSYEKQKAAEEEIAEHEAQVDAAVDAEVIDVEATEVTEI